MFIGRTDYLEKLDRLWHKGAASFVVVSGRRRIGKSTLIEEFAARSKCRFIEIEGLGDDPEMSNQKQLDNFCERLSHATRSPRAVAECWPQAFDALDHELAGNARTIVFLDEISWMGKYDSSFAAFLKNAWDAQFSRHGRLIFVIAASVSAWIQDNVLKSRAFVGRVSLDIILPELSLPECTQFWGRSANRTDVRTMLDVLSITGGVPKYLQEMDTSLSVDENVRNMCFLPEGYLFGDFDRIFDDAFDRTVVSKRRIMMMLADGSASVSDLAEKFGRNPGGSLTQDLRDLVEAGFLSASCGKNPQTGKDVREVRYRIRDNYARFYLKYVLPHREAIKNGLFRFSSVDRLPGWESMLGLQFENLVLNNLSLLRPLIGLGSQMVLSAAPYFRRGGKTTGPGVQIDMLIQTPKAVYLVEVKRRKRIEAAIEDEIQRKVTGLGGLVGKSVRTVLVYEGDLVPEVEESGYFDFLVPAEKLLGR